MQRELMMKFSLNAYKGIKACLFNYFIAMTVIINDPVCVIYLHLNSFLCSSAVVFCQDEVDIPRTTTLKSFSTD